MGQERRQTWKEAAEGLGRQSLLARLSGASGIEAIQEGLASGRPRLAGWAAGRLAALPDGERVAFVEQALDGEAALRLGVLRAVEAGRDWPASIWVRIDDQLEHPDPGVRVAAARCLAKQVPERLLQLVSAVEQNGGSEIARMFCLSGNVELIRPLVEYSDRRLRGLLPAIGWLVTPAWLARMREEDAAFAGRLAEAFGYCDGEPTSTVWERLAEGWSFVAREAAGRLGEQAEERQRLARSLVPTGLATSAAAITGDAGDSVWQAILLAAVRDADRLNLQEHVERSPFDPRALASPQIVTAMHAPAGYLRRILIEEPVKEAERLRVGAADLVEFLIDSARVRLETVEESKAELEMATFAKWRARDRLGPRAGRLRIEQFPILSDDDAPELKSVVLGQRVPMRLARRGSPGMESICRMAIQAGLSDLSPVLGEIEETCRGTFPTIGVELQVPGVDRDIALCWKQALRSLGVPSPQRPEYFQTVEASFRPAWGMLALALGPLLLLKLGLISRPMEMALHVSVGGDLEDGANDLAFLLYFLGMGQQRRPWPSGMTWVLSKGLVHFASDVEPLGPAVPGRTEIRVLRCLAVERDGRLKLDAEYLRQLAATSLLATATQSDRLELKAACDRLRQGLVSLVERLPESFQRLREANFYDSTGDGTDGEWLESLPIVRRLSRVREDLQTPGLRAQVEAEFRTLRDEAVLSIVRLLGTNCLLPAGVADQDTWPTPFGFPLFIPAELRELLA